MYRRSNQSSLDFLSKITSGFTDGDWIQFGVKNGVTKEMQPSKIRKTHLSKRFNKGMISGKCRHYYVSPQAFSYGKRNSEKLFALHNIVIDVDCHGRQISRFLRDIRLNRLGYLLMHGACSEYDMPLPNYIVFTGRGLQSGGGTKRCQRKCVHGPGKASPGVLLKPLLKSLRTTLTKILTIRILSLVCL